MKARNRAQPIQPGFDGAEHFVADVRISPTRTDKRIMRCRPGTFEWRYGREGKNASLYHAGVHYAVLWEQAGTAAASSPDLMKEGRTDWKGLPDGRAVALGTLIEAGRHLGAVISARLTHYCVRGMTTAEIAKLNGTIERNMAPVLHEDLRACAKHFNYL